ncbi:rab GDP dissociation inhibitor alpha-like [Artemia franciscana]|uniref:rab GDP dissociation inhibitor alpha-like n=1 Tax=Artemia franciscana TaxID=6661 RepID=UPI0032D9FD67
MYLQEWDFCDVASYKGLCPFSLAMQEFFDKFELKPDFADFVGRHLALYRDNSYLQRDARYTLIRMKVYCESLARYGEPGTLWLAMASLNHQDAFLNHEPCLSIGRDPGGIAMLSTFDFNRDDWTSLCKKPVDEIVMEYGKVVGVRSGRETARCKQVYCDPSYVPGRVDHFCQVIRCRYVLREIP